MKLSISIPTVSVLALACVFAAVPASADPVVYDNTGPGTYTTNAWSIFGTDSVTDSFTLLTGANVVGANFDVWVLPGDSLTSVTWSITSTPFGAPIETGTAAGGPNSQVATGFGYYPILQESISIPLLPLAAGTYYFELTGGQDAYDTSVWWDESDGPSTADDLSIGPIPSETFQIVATPEPPSILLLGPGLLALALAGLATRGRLLA
jgi:hypothetical protein